MEITDRGNEVEISVIIPAYNSEKFLEKCLNSLSKERYSNIEFILLNDGSTDKTDLICQDFVKKDPRIRYISKENTGVSNTRNRGLELSRGKYVAFLDSDDYLEEDIYTQMKNRIETEQTEACIIGLLKKSETGEVLYSVHPKENKEYIDTFLDNATFGFACNKLYKREVILRNNIFFPEDISMSEDLVFNYRYFLSVDRVSVDKQLQYLYVEHSTSLSQNKKKYFERMKAIDRIKEFLDKSSSEGRKILRNLYEQSFITVNYYILECLKLDKDSYFEEYYSLIKKQENVYKREMELHTKILLYKRKLRLRFVVLKPYVLKILNVLKGR